MEKLCGVKYFFLKCFIISYYKSESRLTNVTLQITVQIDLLIGEKMVNIFHISHGCLVILWTAILRMGFSFLFPSNSVHQLAKQLVLRCVFLFEFMMITYHKKLLR